MLVLIQAHLRFVSLRVQDKDEIRSEKQKETTQLMVIWRCDNAFSDTFHFSDQ